MVSKLIMSCNCTLFTWHASNSPMHCEGWQATHKVINPLPIASIRKETHLTQAQVKLVRSIGERLDFKKKKSNPEREKRARNDMCGSHKKQSWQNFA